MQRRLDGDRYFLGVQFQAPTDLTVENGAPLVTASLYRLLMEVGELPKDMSGKIIDRALGTSEFLFNALLMIGTVIVVRGEVHAQIMLFGLQSGSNDRHKDGHFKANGIEHVRKLFISDRLLDRCPRQEREL